MAGCFECGNKPTVSLKCGEVLDQLRIGQLLKDSAPWTMYWPGSAGMLEKVACHIT